MFVFRGRLMFRIEVQDRAIGALGIRWYPASGS